MKILILVLLGIVLSNFCKAAEISLAEIIDQSPKFSSYRVTCELFQNSDEYATPYKTWVSVDALDKDQKLEVYLHDNFNILVDEKLRVIHLVDKKIAEKRGDDPFAFICSNFTFKGKMSGLIEDLNKIDASISTTAVQSVSDPVNFWWTSVSVSSVSGSLRDVMTIASNPERFKKLIWSASVPADKKFPATMFFAGPIKPEYRSESEILDEIKSRKNLPTTNFSK